MQTALYRALDQQQVEVRLDGAVPAILVEDSTLLLSTTDEYRLQGPRRDRTKLRLRFAFYDEHDLMEAPQRRASSLQWNIDPGLFASITRRARHASAGTIRTAAWGHRLRIVSSLDARGVDAKSGLFLRHMR